MVIVAKTEDGCLIQATKSEVCEILNAVSGQKPEDLKISQKIPAIDYASTITKIKSLKESYEFKTLLTKTEKFVEMINDLESVVAQAAKIEF